MTTLPTTPSKEVLRRWIEECLPRIDWAGHLPLMPHGLLGLWSTLKLKPLLSTASFNRLLGRQHEALKRECVLEQPLRFPHASCDFQVLLDKKASDMANVGHKYVIIQCLHELQTTLFSDPSQGLLLDFAAWIAATEPQDTYWNKRAQRRLQDWQGVLPESPASLSPEALEQAARDVCERDMLPMMDAVAARIKTGVTRSDLLNLLTLAASEKQMHARSEAEAKTSWNFSYLAALTGRLGQHATAWLQAAALINFFPGALNKTSKPFCENQDPPNGPARREELLEALDEREWRKALLRAYAYMEEGQAAALLALLAETVSRRNPELDNGHALLAVSSAKTLFPLLLQSSQVSLLLALTKSLANSPSS